MQQRLRTSLHCVVQLFARWAAYSHCPMCCKLMVRASVILTEGNDAGTQLTGGIALWPWQQAQQS